MSFANKVEQGESLPASEQEKALESHLRFLGGEAEKAEENLKLYHDKKEETKVLDETIVKKKEEIEYYLGIISDAEKTITEKKNELRGLQSQIDSIDIPKAQAEKSALISDISSLRNEEEILKKNISILTEEGEALKKEVDASKENLAIVKRNTSQSIADAESKVSLLVSRLEELAAQNKKSSEDNEKLLMEVRENIMKVEKSASEVSVLEAKKKDLIESLVKIEEQKNTEWETVESELLKREAVVTKREGDASVKESWLVEKEDTLKKTKEELEKFYNRPINNVKF